MTNPCTLDYETLDDNALARLFAARDANAVHVIATRNNQRLFRAAWSILKNRAEAEDIVQNDGNCASCHSGPHFTDAGLRLHSAEEVGMEPLTAQRSATGYYRTTPLRALWQHPPYFHDGSSTTLHDVVAHYDAHFSLGLSTRQKDDLVEYLKSL